MTEGKNTENRKKTLIFLILWDHHACYRKKSNARVINTTVIKKISDDNTTVRDKLAMGEKNKEK